MDGKLKCEGSYYMEIPTGLNEDGCVFDFDMYGGNFNLSRVLSIQRFIK
jgi:hypothetical protein